jgi:serine/threonine-protein kinase
MIPPSTSDLIGKTLGPYRIVREIGRGGMAIVYEAHQGNLARPVAIKMLLPHFSADPAFVQRFLREARSAAALSHANIITIYDVVEQEGQYFIAMQLAPGVSLKKLLEQAGRLPQARVQHIIYQVASALDHAHAKGLVHRDVKPDNIIIGPDDHAILTDFGLAKAAERDAALTAMGATVGTPEYMSPEQAKGQVVGPASDIYSLGVVLYEMLTGRRPFTASDTSALLYLHVHETPPPIQVRALDLSPKIHAVLNRALAKQPDQRFRSAGELAAALAAVPIPRSGRTPAPRPTPMPQPPAPISEHGKTKLLRTPTPLPVPPPIPTPPPKRRRPIGLWLAALLSGVAVLGLAAFLIWQFLFSSPSKDHANLPAQIASPTTLAQITTSVPTKSPAAAPVAAASNTPAPSLTATPTATPTALRATATPTATPSQPTATATIAPTVTPTASQPAPSPTATPTTTPSPTATATTTLSPTATPTTTPSPAPRPTAPPAPTATKVSPATVSIAPTLIAPADGESTTGPMTFSWSWTGSALQANQGFEVRLWKDGQEHYGAADPVRGMSLATDVRGAYGVQQGGSGEYWWTVAVVQIKDDRNDYNRIGPETAPRRLIVNFSGGHTPPPPPP